MDDHWHQPLRHIRGAGLTSDTGQTSGMTRLEAISGASVGSSKVWMGQTHVGPLTSSGDHHHGDTGWSPLGWCNSRLGIVGGRVGH